MLHKNTVMNALLTSIITIYTTKGLLKSILFKKLFVNNDLCIHERNCILTHMRDIKKNLVAAEGHINFIFFNQNIMKF